VVAVLVCPQYGRNGCEDHLCHDHQQSLSSVRSQLGQYRDCGTPPSAHQEHPESLISSKFRSLNKPISTAPIYTNFQMSQLRSAAN